MRVSLHDGVILSLLELLFGYPEYVAGPEVLNEHDESQPVMHDAPLPARPTSSNTWPANASRGDFQRSADPPPERASDLPRVR